MTGSKIVRKLFRKLSQRKEVKILLILSKMELRLKRRASKALEAWKLQFPTPSIVPLSRAKTLSNQERLEAKSST